MTTQPAGDFVPEWSDGEKLRKIRRHLGKTQEEFATALGVKPTTYSAWEADRNSVREPKVIARRLKMLAGVPMWWFLDSERPSGPDGPDGGENGGPGWDRTSDLPGATATVLSMRRTSEGISDAIQPRPGIAA